MVHTQNQSSAGYRVTARVQRMYLGCCVLLLALGCVSTAQAQGTLTLPALAAQTYTQEQAIMDLALPEASGGMAPITYTLSAAPAGLGFDVDTRILSGTPTATGGFPLTYVATDANDAMASQTLSITVNAALTLPALAAQTYTQDQIIMDLALPVASGGTGAITYSLPNVPAGLDFNAATRILSGTPTVAGSSSLTYAATDANDAMASQTLSITVNDALTLARLPAQTYTQDQAIMDLVLPEAAGGTGAITYSLPNVPAGIDFNAATRTLSGTPTVAGSSSLTYAAIDEGGIMVSQTLSINVNDALTLAAPAAQAYTQDQVIGDLTLSPATGGTAPITYALSGVPAGFGFNAATRILSGTPTTAGNFSLTYVATDTNRATDSQTLSITVNDVLTLATPDSQTYTQDQVIANLVLPEASGGTPPITYTLSDVPADLGFDADTRILSGTPTATGGFSLTYVATDANDAMASQTLNITVAVLTLPALAAQTYTQNQTITDLVLPEASGGMAPIIYRLPNVPAGLIFDADTRTLSGTPTATGGFSLTYVATDTNRIMASQILNISISAGLTLAAPAAQTYTQETTISDLTLPEAAGGAAPITYTLSDVPAGLTFDVDTRILSGTPTATGDSSLTYVATDANGAIASQDLSISISEALTLAAPAAQTYAKDTAISDLTLPEAAGGAAPITYALSDVPAGLAFDATTRILSGIPVVAGIYSVAYMATDANGAMSSQTFSINVDVALILSVPADQFAMPGATIADLVLPAASFSTGTVAYALSGVPPGLTFNALTRTLSGTPTAAGDFTLTYIAASASSTHTRLGEGGQTTLFGAGSFLTFDVRVAVTASALNSVSVARVSSATIFASHVTEPASALTYSWRQVSPRVPLVAITDPEAATTSLTVPVQLARDVEFTFGLVVTNADGVASAEARVPVTVAAGPNDAPTANAGANQSINVGVLVVLDGTGSADLENEDLTYSWTQTSGEPTVTLDNTNPAKPTFTAPATRTILTFSLQVMDARGLPSAEADSVTITVDHLQNRAATVKTLLAVVGRTLAGDAVDTLTERFSTVAAGNSTMVAGIALDIAGWRALLTDSAAVVGEHSFSAEASPFSPATAIRSQISRNTETGFSHPTRLQRFFDHNKELAAAIGRGHSIRELMADTNFVYNLGAGTAAYQTTLTLWGRGSYHSVAGEPGNGLDLDGDLYGGYFGVDWHLGEKYTLGLALGTSQSDIDFSETALGEGTFETELTALYVYGKADLNPDFSLWGMVGESIDGDMTLKQKGRPGISSELSLNLYAAGLRQQLATSGYYNFAVTADGFITMLEADGLPALSAVESEASRVRVAIEAEARFGGEAIEMTPQVSVGVRYDGGDAETGIGLDVAGAVTFKHASGLAVIARARALVLHADENLDDAGGSIAVSFDVGKQEQGFAFSLKPVWGQDQSAADNLWQQDRPIDAQARQHKAKDKPLHMAFNAGYGILTQRLLITPFSELGIKHQDDYRLRAGIRLAAKGLNLELYAEQEAGFRDIEQRIELSLTWRPVLH